VFDYSGCIHFHSAYSYDARIPLVDIRQAAVQAKLHFAMSLTISGSTPGRTAWKATTTISS